MDLMSQRILCLTGLKRVRCGQVTRKYARDYKKAQLKSFRACRDSLWRHFHFWSGIKFKCCQPVGHLCIFHNASWLGRIYWYLNSVTKWADFEFAQFGTVKVVHIKAYYGICAKGLPCGVIRYSKALTSWVDKQRNEPGRWKSRIVAIFLLFLTLLHVLT